MERDNIAFFDFDGTITFSDTLKEFIIFTLGKSSFYKNIALLSPYLVAFKLGLLDRQIAKEKLLQTFFGGMSISFMNEKGKEFAKNVIPSLIRPNASLELKNLQKDDVKIVVVSASPSIWINPWCEINGFEHISTELEVLDGIITGKIKGKNCYGQEKISRITRQYRLENYSTIYAYGDSKGDRPMLALAHKAYYKPFR